MAEVSVASSGAYHIGVSDPKGPPSPACAVVKPPEVTATQGGATAIGQGGELHRAVGGSPRPPPPLATWERSGPLAGRSPLASQTRGISSRLPPVGVENPPFSPGSSGEGGQIGDLTTFLPPCGAKPWGSGGAPPTNLILLRNQRAGAVVRRRRDTRHVREPARPRPGPPRRSPGPRPPVVPSVPLVSQRLFHASGVVVALTQNRRVVAPSAGKDLPPSPQAPTAALRFAPVTLAEESWCPLSRPAAP